jgi:hypothetical protein
VIPEATLQPSRKLYALLGELLHKKEPDTYAKLIQFIPTGLKPNPEEIHKYFLSFCKIQDLNPEEYRGNIYKHSKTEQKSLFAAIVITKYGLHSKNISKYISVVLDQDLSWTYKMIKDADVRYRHQKHYKVLVDDIISKIGEV